MKDQWVKSQAGGGWRTPYGRQDDREGEGRSGYRTAAGQVLPVDDLTAKDQ